MSFDKTITFTYRAILKQTKNVIITKYINISSDSLFRIRYQLVQWCSWTMTFLFARIQKVAHHVDHIDWCYGKQEFQPYTWQRTMNLLQLSGIKRSARRQKGLTTHRKTGSIRPGGTCNCLPRWCWDRTALGTSTNSAANGKRGREDTVFWKMHVYTFIRMQILKIHLVSDKIFVM